MARGIIISGRERPTNGPAAFLLSLLITGAGEVYSGTPQRGIALAMARIASLMIIPFHSAIKPGESHITGIFLSLLVFFLITLISPICALLTAIKRKRIIIRKYSSAGFVIIFCIMSLVLLALSLLIFLSSFSIIRAPIDSSPLVLKGDIIAVKKSGHDAYAKGSLVMLKQSGRQMTRIIAAPGDSVKYHNGRFIINGSDTAQSIFTDDELKSLSITSYDVISESGGAFRYPVINAAGQHSLKISLGGDQYYTAPDDRGGQSLFVPVKNDDISGRVEGILFSYKRIAFAIKPFIKAE